MRRLEDLLPISGLPHSGFPESLEDSWCGIDSREAFRERGGNLNANENSISYRYNSFGYRCPEFGQDATVRMISVGCSWVFGQGVRLEETFHELFASRLRSKMNHTVVNWNLGVPGASNDCIARLLHFAVPILKPHLVLVLFTFLSRREHITSSNQYVDYISPTAPILHPESADAWEHLATLSSAYDDQLNLYRNYCSIKCLLRKSVWVYGFVSTRNTDVVSAHLDQTRRALNYRFLDTGRDQLHPGPLTHRSIYGEFWERFIAMKGPGQLCSLLVGQ